MDLLYRLSKSAKTADLTLEPSGTYGDPLRYQAQDLGFSIYRVSPKRSHDYAEVLDGVPSHHDGKSAWILARLHCEGISEPWDLESEQHRNLRALIKEADIYQLQKAQGQGRLESWLARHWPELHKIVALRLVSVLELLAHYGSPVEIAARKAEARDLMAKASRYCLKASKIDAVLDSAHRTIGLAPTTAEASLCRALAREMLRNRRALAEIEKRISAEATGSPSLAALGQVLGICTAAVLVTEVGDPLSFTNTRSYLKAAGLNLRENSSGLHQGRLHISKRGSSRARRWLYLAALRWIQSDRIAKAWYDRKVQRDGGRIKQKAVGALMRKLVAGLWHVARGNEFDSRKLFDTRRLIASTS